MPSRRVFLTTMAAGAGASALGARASWAADPPVIKSPVGKPLALQLYSVREHMKKDVPGTLAQVRAMGFKEVEAAGLWGKTAPELRAMLDAAGLTCTAAHMGLDRLRDDLQGALAEVKVLGARSVYNPWIPHEAPFDREDVMRAAEVFNKAGKAAEEAGLHFGYHTHGYEVVDSPEGNLFDTLARNTDPRRVSFQIDVFHTYHGGDDPVKVIQRYPDRVRSLHIKEISKAFPVEKGKGTAPAEAQVAIGAGRIDWPAVLRAAMKAGVSEYVLEDETSDPLGNIPRSLAYLQGLKL